MVNISQTELDLLMSLFTACKECRDDLPDEVADATTAVRQYIDGPTDAELERFNSVGRPEESPAYRASLKSAGRGHLVR